MLLTPRKSDNLSFLGKKLRAPVLPPRKMAEEQPKESSRYGKMFSYEDGFLRNCMVC